MRETHLSKFYWKTKNRRGAKKAIVAVARKMLTIIYHLLQNQDVYHEEKYESLKEKQETLKLKRISMELKKLGYMIVPQNDVP